MNLVLLPCSCCEQSSTLRILSFYARNAAKQRGVETAVVLRELLACAELDEGPEAARVRLFLIGELRALEIAAGAKP